jgi:hypothetical protein
MPPEKVIVKLVGRPTLLLGLALLLAPAAQADDRAYCTELVSLYRKYVQNSPGRRYDVEAVIALEDCQKGDAARGIPVLERKLRESGFSIPKEFTP